MPKRKVIQKPRKKTVAKAPKAPKANLETPPYFFFHSGATRETPYRLKALPDAIKF